MILLVIFIIEKAEKRKKIKKVIHKKKEKDIHKNTKKGQESRRFEKNVYNSINFYTIRNPFIYSKYGRTERIHTQDLQKLSTNYQQIVDNLLKAVESVCNAVYIRKFVIKRLTLDAFLNIIGVMFSRLL